MADSWQVNDISSHQPRNLTHQYFSYMLYMTLVQIVLKPDKVFIGNLNYSFQRKTIWILANHTKVTACHYTIKNDKYVCLLQIIIP